MRTSQVPSSPIPTSKCADPSLYPYSIVGDTPAEIQAIYASLRPCTRLHSLAISNSRSLPPILPPAGIPPDGFTFLRQLADFLASEPAPFPRLEQLCLSWTGGLDLPGQPPADACFALARALESRSRYPAFRRLEVRARMNGYREPPPTGSLSNETLREATRALRQSLGDVEKGGVQLEVAVER